MAVSQYSKQTERNMHSHKETIKKGPAERQTQKKINEQNAFFMPGEQTLHV